MRQPLECVIGGQRELLNQIVKLDGRVALLLIKALNIGVLQRFAVAVDVGRNRLHIADRDIGDERGAAAHEAARLGSPSAGNQPAGMA